MKKLRKSLIVLGLSATAICGFGFIAGSTKEAIETHATAHVDNFEEYDWQNYSGSYYSFIKPNLTNGLNGTLRTTLTENILPKAWYTYGSSGETHLSSILQQADEDPTNSNNMIYFYTRDSVKKNAASTWNREHVWPQSLSGGCWGTSAGGGSDLLHIRPTYNKTNSTRGNLLYGEFSGGTQCTYEGMTYGYKSGNYFMPLPSVKGDVARDLMYVWTAYKNKYGNLPNVTNTIDSYNTLLKWHTEDKPDIMEAHRNNVSESSLQKNRNPFVDHPEYAWKIFGDSVSASVKSACMNAYPDSTTPTAKTLTSISVSGTANKLVYNAGESFQTAGLTVTASYNEDGVRTTENVTSKVSVSPNPLTAGTTSVTLSYTDGTTTKTTTYSGITVNAPAPTNYGTLQNPLSVSQAKLLILNECLSENSYTSQPIYCKGIAGSFISKDDTNRRIKLNVRDCINVDSVVRVESLNMNADQYKVFESDDEIIFHGYGFKDPSGTYLIKYKDSYNPTLDRNLTKGEIVHVSSIDASIPKNEHHVGDTFSISYDVFPSDATNKNVTFTSSNTSVATVSATGSVNCKSVGSTTLTVTSVDNTSIKKTISLTVFKEPDVYVTGITLEEVVGTFEVGDEVQLRWSVSPSNATNKNVEFIVEDENVVTVSSTGLVTCVGAGSTLIQVHALDGSDVMDSIDFVVFSAEVPVEEIKLPSGLTVEVDETKQIECKVLPENATDKSVVWTSLNQEIATVSNDGKVTGIKEGNVSIKASTPDGDVYSTCEVTVTSKTEPVEKTLVEVVVAKNPNKTTYELNEPYDETGLVIEAHYLDGSSENVTDQCDSNKDKINTSRAGLLRVNYSYSSYSLFVSIYVLDNQPTELKITKNPLKLNYFASEEFSTLGLEVKAVIGGVETIVTNLVSISYDFESEDKFVTIEFGGLTKQIEVTIETGTITVEHKAVDYTYVFEDKLSGTSKEKVTLDSWKILEYNYNSLDSATKQALKTVVTTYGKGEVSAAEGNAEKLKECVSDYDEIYLLHKDEGFNDFMKRSPKAPTPTPDPTPTKGLNPLIVVGIIGGIVVLIIFIIIISVSASKKNKKKHA